MERNFRSEHLIVEEIQTVSSVFTAIALRREVVADLLENAFQEIQDFERPVVQREPSAARRDRCQPDVRRDRWLLSRTAGGAVSSGEGRTDGLDGSHYLRDRYGQRTDRQSHS